MARVFQFYVVLCIAAISSAHVSEVHKLMTKNEMQEVFGTSNHNEVPEHRVVPVFHGFQERSNQNRVIQLTAFERQMKLYLEPTDGTLASLDTPVFRAKSNESADSGVDFERVHDAINSKRKFFQDPTNMAAVSLELGKTGKALIHGVINNLAIRPLPHRLRSHFLRLKRSTNDEFLRSSNEHLEEAEHHVIYKVQSDENPMEKHEDSENDNESPNDSESDDDSYEDSRSDDESHEHDHVHLVAMQHAKKSRKRTLNAVPNVIHPQVMIIVESTLFDLFKRDVNAVVTYLLSFWNAVDLRYRVFLNPEVRFSIGGIILAEDADMTPYILKNRIKVDGHDDNKIDVVKALNDNAEFLFAETSYNKTEKTLRMTRLGFEFDLVITMTSYDMCQFSSKCLLDDQYVCSSNKKKKFSPCVTLGYAYYMGACAYDPEEFVMEAVGIIEDKGGFGAIIPAAHEVGHLLGASHSETNKNGCEVDDGYIMSYKLTVSEKSYQWSNCSASSIKNFLISEHRAQCLFNEPKSGKKVPRLLPGKVYSRDVQCRRLTGTKACHSKRYAENCVKLYCKVKGKNKCQHIDNALVAEGTACGFGYHCINAKCVSKSSKSVLLQLGTTEPPKISESSEFESYDEHDNDINMENYDDSDLD